MTGSEAENFGFPRSSRLIRTEDFGVILRTRNAQSFRVHSAYLSAGCLENGEAARIRVGVTVGKRNAPLSVDRAIVKRALREAARQRLPELRRMLGDEGIGLDVSLRLKAGLKTIGAPSRLRLKKALHADAAELIDSVVARVERRLKARHGSGEA
ncbi:ribonuclease P protein component [Sutterella sp.]|uniref:ribonuclease P protein component n=1 Tax=Sutterella sp. TaxID=1981025 RepID=UPI0026E04A7D|nr:ribonuclease P protein component [Sutterella sp.]MDO5530433.1 ribonuclease P protein component [Sutterella sp.]